MGINLNSKPASRNLLPSTHPSSDSTNTITRLDFDCRYHSYPKLQTGPLTTRHPFQTHGTRLPPSTSTRPGEVPHTQRLPSIAPTEGLALPGEIQPCCRRITSTAAHRAPNHNKHEGITDNRQLARRECPHILCRLPASW